MSTTKEEATAIIARLKNLSTIIDGYSQLGFEFEHQDDVKNAIKNKIKSLAEGKDENTTNDVEVLRAALYEFSELEFNDQDREGFFDILADSFIAKTKNGAGVQPYFSKFGDLVETVDYLLNSTDVKLKKFCTAIRERKAHEEGKGAGNISIIAELDTLLDKFGCPPEPLKPDSKQKV
jgi:hypothetical protein